jgi:hypothetical protein
MRCGRGKALQEPHTENPVREVTRNRGNFAVSNRKHDFAKIFSLLYR